jgi:ubiquinone biosynthesis UbiH/UbiF/VisC/COQ6 family hydroxylase
MSSRIVPFSAPNPRGSTRVFDVALVGDGLVGMACAVAAGQVGLRVGVMAAPHPAAAVEGEPWDRRVYAISPASRRFLERIRVWSQMDQTRIAPVREMRVYGDAEQRARVHFSAFQAGADALAWIVEHRELARVLGAALGYQQNVERIEADAEEFRADSQGVTITSARGAVRAALLVAADGARSKIRDAAGLASTIRSYEQTAVVANFATPSGPKGIARQWFVREGVVALLPLPDDMLSLVWSAPTRLAASLLDLDPAALAQRVQAVVGSDVRELRAVGGSSGFPLNLLSTVRQTAMRLALVGDAAHVVHPLAGQGLNLGLQDAEVLVDILAARESFRDCGDPVLLRRYERARSEAVWAMRQVTHGLQGLFSSSDQTMVRLRATGMKLVDQIPVLKRALIRQAMG